MKLTSLRKRIHALLHLGRAAGQVDRPTAAARIRRRSSLHLEELENRTVLSTIQPVIAASLQLSPSDSAGGTSHLMMSADGRFTVYSSTASNLVPGQVDTAVAANIFLYDQQTGTTTLVSHVAGSAITGTNGDSDFGRISGDDRYVVYESKGTNLVAGQNGPAGQFNVYLYDRLTGTNTLVSHRVGTPTTTGNDGSENFYTPGFGFSPASGQFLLYSSNATDLVAGQNGPTHENLFLYNTAAGTSTLVSHSSASALTTANGDTNSADLTPDGNYVVFQSFATDLVPGQNGPIDNIFLYNNFTGSIQLISRVANSSTAAAGFSLQPFISADGSLITYLSYATDLVPGQSSNGSWRNVFNYYTFLGTTTLVSGADGSPSVGANGDSYESALSTDGSTIAFLSNATNLIPGQGNNTSNAFVYDTDSGVLTLASHISGSATTAAGGIQSYASNSYDDVSVSADGSLVVYLSAASNLTAGQPAPYGVKNVFLYDATSGQNSLISEVTGSSTMAGNQHTFYARISADGSTVAFLSNATNLTPGFNVADGGENLYIATSDNGPTLASRSAFQANATSLVYGSSGDGRFVLFGSNAPDVVPNQEDTNFDQDLFLEDRSTTPPTITLVSHIAGSPATTGDHGSPTTVGVVDQFATPVLSNDGNFVAFTSQATNLVAGQSGTPVGDQVFLFDRLTGTVTLISHASSSTTTLGNDRSDSSAISADGTYVTFRSMATNLVAGFTETAGIDDPNVYLYDTVTGTTTLVSHAAGNPLRSGDAGSYGAVLSDDGRYVAYEGLATDLVAGGVVYPSSNVYLYDRLTGTNTLVSHVVGKPALAPDPTTAPGAPPSVSSFDAVLSADGSTVAFCSFATNVVAGQSGTTDTTDVFLYNVATGANQLVSGVGGSASVTANNYSDSPVLNDGGGAVAFRSTATNLVAGQINSTGSTSNIFLFNRQAGTITLVSHAVGLFTTTATGAATDPVIDGIGGLVVYLSTAALVPNQVGVGVNNAFLDIAANGANVLLSGQGGSASLASTSPTYLAILSRDPVAFFNLLSGTGAASAGFSNTLVQLVLSENTVAAGEPPGTLVGTLSVTGSFYAGAFLPPTYSLPATESDNGLFSLVNIPGGQANLFTGVTANPALRQSYQLSVHVNFNIEDLDDVAGSVTVVVGPPTSQSVLATAGNGTVVAALPGFGVWRFEDVGGWRPLTANPANQVGVDANGDVVAILGGGVWRYEDSSGWRMLTGSTALQVGIAGNGIVTAVLANAGLWRFEDANGWQLLTTSAATQVGVDANGDVVAALLNAGVWRWEDAVGWQLLTTTTPLHVAIAGNGIVVAALQGAGVWRWEDTAGWLQLTTSNASAVSVDDAGDLVAALAGAGVWRWQDAAGWQLLTTASASQVYIGGNGTVVAGLPGAGVWRFKSVAGWQQLTAVDAG